MGHPFDARLGANENIFGPSPKAIAAMQAAATGIWMYGDPENHDLRHALADFHAVAPENIVVGEGIDGLLGYLVRLLIEPGDAVVTSLGAYPTFNYHVAGFGGAEGGMPGSMSVWCQQQMLSLTGNDDTTLADFLYSLTADDEVRSYLNMYLGESKAVEAFAKEFTLRKRAARGTGESRDWQT